MEETTLSGRLPTEELTIKNSNKKNNLSGFFPVSSNKNMDSLILNTITIFFAGLFFYQAIYKLVDLQNYGRWLFFSPFIHNHWSILSVLIPIVQIVTTLLLLIPRFRTVMLYFLFVCFLGYLIYLVTGQQKGYLIMQPYEVFWFLPKWNLMILLNAFYSFTAYKAITIDQKLKLSLR
ncbi:hypothetical protein A4H97_21065 [Niastella yeongjuensis]|uniref:Methylamine utilisation protein MauE domain-containing protein n=1 Tax=Niastella yeongjuensis TaxID=354355 RepID=A0A1V9FCP5_9BACT|nr:MauE/DoxX family redox-associated membrane protein [Niastella yeongjuensis]OQP56071.1 hypothetical protein A4H97_21065 [Niastella yeongjuensis]SEP23961.1 hypothetical protein SAMN05660816_04862 [Niastella yeongjuensis]